MCGTLAWQRMTRMTELHLRLPPRSYLCPLINPFHVFKGHVYTSDSLGDQNYCAMARSEYRCADETEVGNSLGHS